MKNLQPLNPQELINLNGGKSIIDGIIDTIQEWLDRMLP